MTTCCIPGCIRTTRARGYCYAHYIRWWKYGDPLAGRTLQGDPDAALADAIESNTDECIIWKYHICSNGYGRITRNRKPCSVNRLVCQIMHGDPPSEYHHAAHSCGVRSCCNPRHIRWATPKENNADKILHGTVQRGEKGPLARLSEADVRRILMSSETQRSIAKQYGVTQATISAIKTKKIWRHLHE